MTSPDPEDPTSVPWDGVESDPITLITAVNSRCCGTSYLCGGPYPDCYTFDLNDQEEET